MDERGTDGGRDLAGYFARAQGRPAWALWGKAKPGGQQGHPAHPLLCHMVDVGVAAQALLDVATPSSTRRRLLAALGLEEGDEGMAWLGYIVALHDLGKATPPFQSKWAGATGPLLDAGFDFGSARGGRDHGTLGVALARERLAARGIPPLIAHQLARAVAAHHGTFPPDHEANPPALGAEAGKSPTWHEARLEIDSLLARAFRVEHLEPPRPPSARDWAAMSALAGFTSVADWLGSMAEVFRYEAAPATIEDYVRVSRGRAPEAMLRAGFSASPSPAARNFDQLFGFSPRPLQQVTADLCDRLRAPFCLIVEAPMGDGKTEAALYLTHALDARGIHQGTFLALPTQATANQMFDRLARFLLETRPDQRVNLQLLHGEAAFDTRVSGLLSDVHGPGGGLVCEPWFLGKKRGLLAPFSAGTIDQALLGVLRCKHAFVRQFGLAGKTVIFDEVHAYDAYTSTLLDRLLAWLGALGATAVLLSATLPSTRRRGLLAAYAGRAAREEAPCAYPRASWIDGETSGSATFASGRAAQRLRVEWMGDDVAGVATAAAALARGGANVAILRNTVARAQATFEALRGEREAGALGVPLLLIHARFPTEDRRRLEQELMGSLGKTGDRPRGMVVVGTQVLEQSLDVDFDVLLSDAAPVDLLLQRAGRVHRHARATRPEVAAQPTLRVLLPPGEPCDVALRDVAGVYEAYVVRRSLLALRGRQEISLPDDIEPLVEAVYSAPEPEGYEALLRADRAEMEARATRDELLAKNRVWPPPVGGADPFGWLEMPFEEDDPDVAKMLRAETRLGEDSAEIVCLYGSEKAAWLDSGRARPFDLAATPTPAAVRAVAQRTVRVATRGLPAAVRDLPCPSTWAEVSVLRRRRPLYFGSQPGPLRVGRFELSLDAELGLVVKRAKGKADAVSTDD